MVFVKSHEKQEKGVTVAYTYGKRPKSGDVGFELECEGRGLVQQDELPEGWTAHVDGSLRGEAMEYVFNGPKTFKQAYGLVDTLFEAFKKKETRLNESIRTSVHVHLNVGGFYLPRLVALASLWFTFEDALTHYCGEHRVGNLFCLRAKDSPNIVTRFRRYVLDNMTGRLPDNNHYAGLNFNAIEKFQSLEFRTMRGLTSAKDCKTWLQILERLYDASQVYERDPRRICEEFSMQGPMEFFIRLLGDEAKEVLDTIQWDREKFETSAYEGIRYAQDLCYAKDWDNYKTESKELDPFSRPGKKSPIAEARMHFDAGANVFRAAPARGWEVAELAEFAPAPAATRVIVDDDDDED